MTGGNNRQLDDLHRYLVHHGVRACMKKSRAQRQAFFRLYTISPKVRQEIEELVQAKRGEPLADLARAVAREREDGEVERRFQEALIRQADDDHVRRLVRQAVQEPGRVGEVGRELALAQERAELAKLAETINDREVEEDNSMAHKAPTHVPGTSKAKADAEAARRAARTATVLPPQTPDHAEPGVHGPEAAREALRQRMKAEQGSDENPGAEVAKLAKERIVQGKARNHREAHGQIARENPDLWQRFVKASGGGK